MNLNIKLFSLSWQQHKQNREHKIHSKFSFCHTLYIQYCLSDVIHAIRLILQILFNVEVGHEPCEIVEPVKFKCDMTKIFQLEYFERYDTPDLSLNDCSNVHGSQYCIKHIGRFEGLFEISSSLIYLRK